MNEHIKHLEKQCWNNQTNHLDTEKFVQLIVRECAGWVNDNVGLIDEEARADLLKYFGVDK